MVDILRIDGSTLDPFLPMIPGILQKWAVDERGWRFYGITSDKEAAGIISLNMTGDHALVKFIYLLPDHRGLGAMDDALVRLSFVLREEGFSTLQMDYIPHEYPFVAELADRFDFRQQSTDRAYFRFRVGDVKRCKASTFTPRDVMKLKLLPEGVRNKLYEKVEKKGFNISDLIHPADMVSADFDIMEHSLVYIENASPKGLLLVQKMGDNKLPGGSASFGKIYPEPSALNIALVYVGTVQIRTPLYLLSALCRNTLHEYEDNDVLTGYFPDGQMTRLLESTLGVNGHKEVSALLDLERVDSYLNGEESISQFVMGSN